MAQRGMDVVIPANTILTQFEPNGDYPMKTTILCLILMTAVSVSANAEIFRPALGNSHAGHGQRESRGPIGYHGERTGWHGRNDSWRIHTDWWWPAAALSIGYGDGYYAGWDGWPWWKPRYDWRARPVIYTVRPRSVYVPASRTTGYYPTTTVSAVANASDGIRDARSPEQLRAIYGAQAEALISRN